jgi:adenine-specific DNA methylase
MPNNVNNNKILLEEWLPLKETNVSSVIEKGFKQARARYKAQFKEVFGKNVESLGINIPVISNIHTWFARRPCSASRVLTLAAITPSSVPRNMFMEAVGFSQFNNLIKYHQLPILYNTRPNVQSVQKAIQFKHSKEIMILDPMAGGGSIPLESARLSFRTVAVEYNPVAYLILKASVEFPAKYADAGLFEETLKVSKDFIRKAREELGRYYGEDAENYIFARGIRCPFCGGLIPIQGIEPAITKASRFKKRFLKITYDKTKRSFSAETSDKAVSSGTIAKRGNNIKCPYEGCGKWFQLRGQAKDGTTVFDQWFSEHAELMEKVVEGFVPITSEVEEKTLNLHIPLVKQVGSSFYAIWEAKLEREKFISALHALSNELFNLQNFIPLDEISTENVWASTARGKGLLKWYMLYNPRQLLAIAKLSKIIAEKAEELASKNGEFGAAIVLYLALALDKIIDYNTIATHWQGTRFKTGIAHTLRGESTLDFRKEYVEMVITLPGRSLEWALEPDIAESGDLVKTAGGVLPVLRFLCNEFRGSDVGNYVNVYLGDATQLSVILPSNSVDVINVDPPYFEQVIYSDRSEFFWVVLRRALAPVLELLFKPGLKLSNWSWTSPTVPREREVVTYDKEDSEGRFSKLFSEFIKETSRVLKEDGVLTLWFTHPTAQAWRVVSESLYQHGYVVPKVWPLQTEMATRYKKHVNIVAQEMSLVIVGRKYPRQKLLEVSPQDVRGSLIENSLFTRTVEETVESTRKIIIESNASPADTAALMFGTALSVASRFELPIGAAFKDLYDAAITAVVSRYTEPLIYKILTETGPVKFDDATAQKIARNIAQGMLWDPATRSYLTLWLISRVELATAKIRQEPLGLHFDLVQTVGKLCGFGIENLKHYSLITEKAINKTGKAYYPQFLEMLTLPGGQTFLDRLMQVAPGNAAILARMAMTESGDPAARAKAIKAKMSMHSDRKLSSNAALAIILLETARGQDLGYRIADKTKITGYFPGMDESDMARFVRELAIKTLTYLVF